MSGAVTEDGFLGGSVRIAQPKNGFRSGTDAVLLAAAVPAKAGERVLELGCGAGVAALCLMTRVAGVSVTGLEILPEMADLARANARSNRLDLEVLTGDVALMPPELRARSFDHVMANPPYFRPAEGTGATDVGRAIGFAGPTPLAAWADAAIRRLRPGGRLTMIQRAERMPELLAAVGERLGALRVLPLAGRAGRPADRVLLHGRKGSKAPFRLLPALVMHAATTHAAGGGDDFAPALRAVLREGHALPVDWL